MVSIDDDDPDAHGMMSGSIREKPAVLDSPDFGAYSLNFWNVQKKNKT